MAGLKDTVWLVAADIMGRGVQTCLQYAHMGAVEFTVILKVGKTVSVSETGWNPESKPI